MKEINKKYHCTCRVLDKNIIYLEIFGFCINGIDKHMRVFYTESTFFENHI